eukprot:848387-Prorocentrum_minimum.AAC.2
MDGHYGHESGRTRESCTARNPQRGVEAAERPVRSAPPQVSVLVFRRFQLISKAGSSGFCSMQMRDFHAGTYQGLDWLWRSGLQRISQHWLCGGSGSVGVFNSLLFLTLRP